MRREEIQGHVAPVVCFLRIELMNGHQFDNSNPKFLQIRNFFDQTRIGSANGFFDFAGAACCKSFYVQLVDDCVRIVQWRFILTPFEIGVGEPKNAERSAASICSRPLCRVSTEAGRKKNGSGVRIKEDFLRIKRIPAIGIAAFWAVDSISVVVRVLKLSLFNTAMPDSFGLVPQWFKPDLD